MMSWLLKCLGVAGSILMVALVVFPALATNNDLQVGGWHAPWDKSAGSLIVEGGIYSHKDASGIKGQSTYRRAIDFGAPEGLDVLASAKGKVVTSDWLDKDANGNRVDGNQRGLIVIEHDEGAVAGYCSVYLHLHESAFGWTGNLSVAVPVTLGQYIGKSGRGWGNEHIHFAVYEQFHPNGAYDETSYCSHYSEDAKRREVIPHFVGDNRDLHYQDSLISENSVTNPPRDAPAASDRNSFRSFADVPYTSSLFPYVEVLADLGAINKDGTFGHEMASKEEFVKMLIIAMGQGSNLPATGSCVFSDVCPGTSFYRYVRKCKELGICGGDSSGKFNPTQKMWKNAVAKFVVLAADRREPTACSTRPYLDVPTESEGHVWCRYINRLKQIFARYDESPADYEYFQGDSLVPRGEAAFYLVVGLGKKNLIPRFWDVWTDSPFYSYVMDNYAAGVINGCTTNLYCANDPASPGHLAKMLVEAMGEHRTYSDGFVPFLDVPLGDTFYHHVRRLSDLGKGTGMFAAAPGGYFGVADQATRYRTVEMIVWALRIKGYSCDSSVQLAFPDVPLGHPQYDEVQCAVQWGIVHGKSDGKFHGDDKTNRLEVAKMIALGLTYRFQDSPTEEVGGNSLKNCGASTRTIHLDNTSQNYVRILGGESECYNVPGSAEMASTQLADATDMQTAATAAGSTSKRLVTLVPSRMGVNTKLTIELLDAGQGLIRKVEGMNPFRRVQVSWDANKEPVRYLRLTNGASGSKSVFAYFGTAVESSVCNPTSGVCAGSGNDPGLAADGNPSTSWAAQAYAPQWFEVDLGTEQPFFGVAVTLEQSPEGESEYAIHVAGADRRFEEVHTFAGRTSAGDVLSYRPQTAVPNVRYVRALAVRSPSWIAFREVHVYTTDDPPQDSIYRSWPGYRNLEQTETTCQGARLAVYLVDKLDDDFYHLVVHRPDAPEIWDHSLMTSSTAHGLQVNGCEIRHTQMEGVVISALVPTGDPTYAWRIEFRGFDYGQTAGAFFRVWQNVVIREQTETQCEGTRLAVYLVDMNDGTHIIAHRGDAPEVWDHRLITDPTSRTLEVSGCDVRLIQGARVAFHRLQPTGDSTYAWRIAFVRMEDDPTGGLYRSWPGYRNLEQTETTCQGARLAVYLVDKLDDDFYHLVVHRPDAPEIWDHSLMTSSTAHGLQVNGCEIRHTQMEGVVLSEIVPTGDPTYAWRIVFQRIQYGQDAAALFRMWQGATIREQAETICQNTRLAVYLADMWDGTHIITHRSDAPEAWDHRLITDPRSHSLAVDGCNIRLTQAGEIALHRLIQTQDLVYAWKITFLWMEEPASPLREWNAVTNLQEAFTTCNGDNLALYLADFDEDGRYLVTNRGNALQPWDHRIRTDNTADNLAVAGCNLSIETTASGQSPDRQRVHYRLRATGDLAAAWQFVVVGNQGTAGGENRVYLPLILQ